MSSVHCRGSVVKKLKTHRKRLFPTLSKVDLEELAAIHDIMPKWMAGPIRARLSHRFMFPSRDVDAPHESRSMESSMKDQLGCVAEAR